MFSLPWDAEHLTAEFPEALGHLVIHGSLGAFCRCAVTVIFAALCLQFRGHGAVDGGLSSLHRCFGEGLCKPHDGLLRFSQVPPQFGLNHSRMESIRCDSSTFQCFGQRASEQNVCQLALAVGFLFIVALLTVEVF